MIKEVYRLVKPSHLVAFDSDGSRALPGDWLEDLTAASVPGVETPLSLHLLQVHEVSDKTRRLVGLLLCLWDHE